MHQLVDATVATQKALSAIARLEERYGTEYVVDFICGSNTEAIADAHRQMKTFGVGAGFTRQQWLNHLRDLISFGYLQRTASGALAITEKGWKVLRGGESVWLKTSSFGNKIGFAKNVHRKTFPELEPDLLEELKKVRKYLAAKYEVETEEVIPHSRLCRLATYLPANLEGISALSGFDEERVKRYGREFLKIILDYMEINGLSSRFP